MNVSPDPGGASAASESAPDPVGLLRRWEDFGAVWRVVARHGDAVTVALCRCDGGEEVQRLTSTSQELHAYLAGRGSSDSPEP